MPDPNSTVSVGVKPVGVDLQELLTAELASDVRASGRAHERYLQVLDRAYLEEYLSGQDVVPGKVADLNTASHAPTPQPFVVPNFVTPSGTVPHA
jgi:hypothetical protein